MQSGAGAFDRIDRCAQGRMFTGVRPLKIPAFASPARVAREFDQITVNVMDGAGVRNRLIAHCAALNE